MRYSLTSVFYAMALTGATLGAFGPAGVVPAGFILLVWASLLKSVKPHKSFAEAGCIVLVFLCLAVLLLPAGPSRLRAPGGRFSCMSQLRQLGLALHAYQADYGCFPPAYVADERGRPMHSWRVLLLPYLEEQVLYDAYDFNEPWDGPNNRQLAKQMPAPQIFRCSRPDGSKPGMTSYVAIVGPRTMWPGEVSRRLDEVTDRVYATLLLVETHDSDIHWMETRDLTVDEFAKRCSGDSAGDSAGARHRPHCQNDWLSERRGWQAVFGYGRVDWLNETIPAHVLRAWSTVDGGEQVAVDDGKVVRHWKWGRIVALALFLVLAVLPVIRLPRRIRERRAQEMERSERS